MSPQKHATLVREDKDQGYRVTKLDNVHELTLTSTSPISGDECVLRLYVGDQIARVDVDAIMKENNSVLFSFIYGPAQ